MRDRMLNKDLEEDSHIGPSPSRREQPKRSNKDDDELKRAIEASKRSFSQETAKQAEEKDLAAAIKLSQEEEEARRRAAEDANARSLFDDKCVILVLEDQF
jgi:epsin